MTETELPRGTVIFLFTDIEGSTALWERDRHVMEASVRRHRQLLRNAIESHGGHLFKMVGDAVQGVFFGAGSALAAAIAAQRALSAEPWPDPPGSLRVRMALHAGEAYPQDGDYLAAPLNRLSRLLAVGRGGQILLTQAAQQLARDDLEPNTDLQGLGTYLFRDLREPEVVFQVVAPGLGETLPPPRTLPSHPPYKSRELNRSQIRDQALHFLYARYEAFGPNPLQISQTEMDEAVIRLGVPDADLRRAFRELVEDGLAEGHPRPGTGMHPEDGLVWISAEGRRRIEALPPSARFSQQIREQARLARVDDQVPAHKANLSQTDLAAVSALAVELRENLELLKTPRVSRWSWVPLRRGALDRAAPILSRLPAEVAASITAAAPKLELYNATARSIEESNYPAPTRQGLEEGRLQPRIAAARSALEEAIESLDHWLRNQQNTT